MEFELIGILIGYSALMLGLSYGFILLVKGEAKKFNRLLSTFLVFLYCSAGIIFLIGLSSYSFDYRVPIDPVDNGYSPISKDHLFSFLTFYFLSIFSIYKVWRNGKHQPPLLIVIFLVFIIIGIVINVFLAIQLSSRNDGEQYLDSSGGQYMMIAPIVHILISLILVFNIVKEESFQADQRSFKNRFLNELNNRIQRSKILPVWSLMALLPIFLIITLILILFGQEYNSLTKVFTETTTWHFSQETHPPYLDHQGHYLCTVAACGSSNIVKPLRLGNRHGQEIIVNRQLLIANAFEDLLMTKYPRTHKLIRRNYDKYGYPLSKDINTKLKSNLTYIVMKPLEWMFLIYIYLNTERPEKLINEQYKLSLSNPSLENVGL